jgi:catalase
VCEGTFSPAPEAAKLSKAAHLQPGASVAVTVRFSDGAPDPLMPDNSPKAGPRGMAIRFALPGGDETDIVAMSHNGFIVGNGDDFLTLQTAAVATNPTKPHPWPIEEFLAAHPRAMKFVVDNQVAPASFASEAYFSNNAFVFVNKEGAKQPFRYQVLPVAGVRHLSDAEAKDRSAEFLFDDLKSRLGSGPVQFRLVAQLPNPGDPTSDASVVWPDDRRTVELGTISVKTIVADSDAAQQRLAFDPVNLTDGIELSDDPVPPLRSSVYALSVKHRRENDRREK